MDRYYSEKYPASVTEEVKTDTYFFNEPISDIASPKQIDKEKVKRKNQEMNLDGKIIKITNEEVPKVRRPPIRRSDSKTCSTIRRVI